VISQCPDCDRMLAPGATLCRCGWKQPERTVISRVDVIARAERQVYGDETEFQQRCRDGLKAKGLERLPGESSEQHIARMRAWIKGRGMKRFNDKGVSA
jgi:hypothetical protein